MKIVVAGATSAIAVEVLREAVRRGDTLFLIARDAQKLAATKADLVTRGGTVETTVADLDDLARHEPLLDDAEKALGGFDVLLVAHGVLPDEARVRADPLLLDKLFRTNFVSAASLAEAAARRFEKRGAGTIAVVSSVAGDRGRQSNYAYGASKAALSAYLSGLRNRLARANVAVVDIRPGQVDTPMTAHLPKGPLFARADVVGRGIYRAIEKRRDVVYVPFFWSAIMCVIRSIPERVFKRMKL